MLSATFLSAGWLWAIPIAAAPVIVHLAFKLKRKAIRLPSLMFFHRLEPRLHARKRLRDLIVLALRVLLILAAILALGHPLWQGVGGGGGAAVLLLIDNSASMAAPSRPGGPTALVLAGEAAGALVAALDARDSAGVVLAVADRGVPGTDELTTDRSKLRTVLDRIRSTQARADSAQALVRAGALLSASTAARREIHLFTDAQEHDWGAVAVGTSELPAGVQVVVHRIASEAVVPDAALADLRLPERAIIAGRPVHLRASFVNATGRPAPVTVHIADDAGKTRSETVTVPPHGRMELPLAVAATTPGDHWVRVWCAGDAFAGDDQGFAAFTATAHRSVWFIGRTASYGALPIALDPTGDGTLSGLLPVAVEAAQLAAGFGGQQPVLVALCWDDALALGADTVQRLMAWMDQGGRVLLVPHPETGLDSRLHPPGWTDCAVDHRFNVAAGEALMAVETGAPAWRDLVGSDGAVDLGRSRAARGVVLKPASGMRILLGTEDGRPLIAERAIGKGALVVSGLAFDRRWTDLPMHAGFLALAQGLALPAGGGGQIPILIAGEPPRLPDLPPALAIRLRSVTGDRIDWQGPASAMPVPAFAGVYQIAGPGGDRLFAMRAAAGEGAPGRIAGGRLPALGALPHEVRDYTGGDALVADWRRRRTGLDLMPLLLVLALAALAVEGWLANIALVRTPPRLGVGMGTGMWRRG